MISDQFTVTQMEPELLTEGGANASLAGNNYRAEAREADGTFLEQGYGPTDTLASAALAGDLLARAPQQSTRSQQERFVKFALRALQAWEKRQEGAENVG